MNEAIRYDQGKNQLDLVPPSLIEEVGKVMTLVGTTKYPPDNWRKGMSWRKCIASLKRHILAFEKGEDFDPETGLFHLAHAGCNIAFLLEYYKLCPEKDDRVHLTFAPKKKIGLDVDEVIADLVGTLMEEFPNKLKKRSEYWRDPVFLECFNKVKDDRDFYLRIKPKVDPLSLPFEPTCYITARNCPTDVTIEWLQKHGFPSAFVHTVPMGTSKVEVAKSAGIDIFVDDNYDNYVDLNKNGICTFLMDAPHNRRYNVGYRRIQTLEQLV